MSRSKVVWIGSLLMLGGCASQVREKAVMPTPPPAVSLQEAAKPGLKHRIAIAKFEDKTGSQNNLFGSVNNVGGQAADALASHLIKTEEFVVLERQNMKDLESENALQGNASQFVGVSAMIFGAVTELGNKTEWVDAGLSKKKVQTAHAKVTIRLVDPKTGVAFFSEFGEADAKNEANQTLGFGGKTSYDATLTDKAVNAAIAKLVGNIMNSLHALPWKAPILDIQDGVVMVGAGKQTGLKVGDVLQLYKPGKQVKNKATGAMVELPGKVVGKLKVNSLFGTDLLSEGAACTVAQSTENVTTDLEVRMEQTP
jgi:curli biogenesis system outer membrane secretion channel CsgG